MRADKSLGLSVATYVPQMQDVFLPINYNARVRSRVAWILHVMFVVDMQCSNVGVIY